MKSLLITLAFLSLLRFLPAHAQMDKEVILHCKAQLEAIDQEIKATMKAMRQGQAIGNKIEELKTRFEIEDGRAQKILAANTPAPQDFADEQALMDLRNERSSVRLNLQKMIFIEAAAQTSLAPKAADPMLLAEKIQKILIDRNVLNPNVAPICAAQAQSSFTLEGIYTLVNRLPQDIEAKLQQPMIECVDFVTFLNHLNPKAPPKNENSEDVGLHYGKCVAKFPSLAGIFKPRCGDVVGRISAADGRSDLHERAAYVVDRMTNLNLVPPTVQITSSIRDRQNRYRDRNVSGSLQLWFENMVPAKNLHRYDMSLRLQLFDYLNGNCDRHLGNVLLSKTTPAQEIAIDNGMAFNSGYCRQNFKKALSLEDQLERSLRGLSTNELKRVPNEIKKLLDGFDPNSTSFQSALCDELKYGLLSDRERIELNQRLHYLHNRVYNRHPDPSYYCTEQIDPVRPRNQFGPQDCYEKKILR